MKLSELIKDLQHLGEVVGGDPEFQLFDKERNQTLVNDPDGDVQDFEVLRGDNLVVIEF